MCVPLLSWGHQTLTSLVLSLGVHGASSQSGTCLASVSVFIELMFPLSLMEPFLSFCNDTLKFMFQAQREKLPFIFFFVCLVYSPASRVNFGGVYMCVL